MIRESNTAWLRCRIERRLSEPKVARACLELDEAAAAPAEDASTPNGALEATLSWVKPC
jgi:hypothetical protein